MRFSRHIQRRPRLYLGSLVLISLFLFVASIKPTDELFTAVAASIEQPDTTIGDIDTREPAWVEHEGAAFNFSYPEGWMLQSDAGTAEDGERFVLEIPSRGIATTLTVNRLGFAKAASGLEDWMVAEITSNDEFTRSYLRRLPFARTSGTMVARVHYVVERASGEQVRGIRYAASTEEGHTYLLDLQTSGTETVLKANEADCMKMLGSVVGTPAKQATDA